MNKKDKFLTIEIFNIQDNVVTLNLEIRGSNYRYFYDSIKISLGDSLTIYDNQSNDEGHISNLVKLPRSIGDLEVKDERK